jgi:hypothetical protein
MYKNYPPKQGSQNRDPARRIVRFHDIATPERATNWTESLFGVRGRNRSWNT